MQDELLTIKEAAQFFGVSTRTLLRWEEKGVLKSSRTIGNQRRYSKGHLAELLRSPQKTASAFESIISQPAPQITQQPKQTVTPVQVKKPSLFAPLLGGAVLGLLVMGVLVLGLVSAPQLGTQLNKWVKSPQQGGSQNPKAGVLASTDRRNDFVLKFNAPAIFGKKVTFLDSFEIKNSLKVDKQSNLFGGINTNNSDINAGTGRLTASNIIYSLLAGTNIAITGDPQNPTISATDQTNGVTSLQGQSGVLALSNGSGISLNGLQITNTGVLSFQGQSGTVTLNGDSGISVSGTSIANTDRGSSQNIFKVITAGGTDINAGSNNDQLTFAAGSGITITGDAGSKTVTITGSSTGLTGLTTNGVLYATSSTDATTLAPGTSGYVLQSNGAGSPPSWVANSASGNPPFDTITSGTNTVAAMVVGSGASLNFSGSGTINASTLNGATFANPGAIGSATAGSGAFTTVTGSSFNGLTVTNTGSNTLTIASGKTLTVNNTLTLAGTDGTSFSFPNASGTIVTTDATQTLTNKTIAAGSNTITGLTNSNLSGSAGITNANLANSSLTVTAGTGLSGGGVVSLGGSVSLNNAGVTGASAGTGISIDQATGNITITNNGVTSAVAGAGIGLNAGSGAVTITNNGVTTLTGTANRISVSGSTGAVTLNLPQDIHTGANPTFAGATLSGLTTAGGVLYTNGSGTVLQTGVGGGAQCLLGGATPTWGSCAAGSSMYLDRNGTTLYPVNTGDSLLLADSGTVSNFRLEVNGKQTGKALVVFNETGDQDIFTASSSGTTRFTIANNGNVTATGNINAANFSGSSAGTNTGDVSLSGQNYLSLAGQTITANAISLSGSHVTNNLGIGNGGTGLNSTPTNGQLLIGNGSGYTLGTMTQGSGIGISNGAGTITISNAGVLSLAGTTNQISVSGATGAVTLSLSQDIHNAATPIFAGLTLSAFTNNGGLLYTNGSGTVAQTTVGNGGECLKSAGGGAPTWGTCASGSNLWQQNDGTVSPFSNSLDLLVGGTSTASAKFAFINTNSGTPTASISANSGNNATYLTGDGTLATTNRGSLILGNSGSYNTTGNILLNPNGTGYVGIGVTAPASALDVNGKVTTRGSNSSVTIYPQDGSGNFYTLYSATGDLSFYNGALRAALSVLGQFGLGLNNNVPQAQLDVQADVFSLPGAYVHGSTGKATLMLDQTSTAGDLFTASQAGTTKFVINNAGKVGIGTSNPQYQLDIAGNTSSTNNTDIPAMRAVNASTAGNSLAMLESSSGNGASVGRLLSSGVAGSQYTMLYTSTATPLLFGTSGVERIRIDTSGNMGINTVAMQAALDVRATSGTAPAASVSGATSISALVVDQSGNGDIFTASSSGATRFAIANNGNIRINGLTNCNTIDTDSSGLLSCGTDSDTTYIAGTDLDLTGTTFSLETTIDSVDIINLTGTGTINGLDSIDNTSETTIETAIDSLANLTTLTLASDTITDFTGDGLQMSGSSLTAVLGTSIANAELDNDTIDFDKMIDSMTLDATTSIALGGFNFNLGTNAGNGTVIVQPNAGGQAALIVNKQGINDIFTASASGTTRFAITNGGTVAIGNFPRTSAASTPTGTLHLWGTGSGGSDSILRFGDVGTGSNPYMKESGTGDSDQLELGGRQGLIFATGTGGSYGVERMRIDSNGNVGINTQTPLGAFDVRATNATNPAASVSGATNHAVAVIDQSGNGDIFTASKSGATKFTIKNSGAVLIGNATDGITFDPTGATGPVSYTGTARPTKKITMSPEYFNAILTASGSADTNGLLTSDASMSAALSNYQTYYEWTSSLSTFQDFTIAVRVTLPEDFSGWSPNNDAIQLRYNTELNGAGSNKFDMTVYNTDVSLTSAQAATPVVLRTSQISSSNKTWTTLSIDDSDLTDGGAVAIDAAGETAIIFLKVYSKDSNHVQLGDLVLKYLSKF